MSLLPGCISFRWINQRKYPSRYFLHDGVGNGSKACGASGPPVQALQLIAQDRAFRLEALREFNFERIAFYARGNGAHECEPHLSVVRLGGDHQRGTLASLLASGLGIELEPHDIAPLGNVRPAHYQTSLPTGPLVSTSPWRFLAVIFRTSSFNWYVLRLTGFTTRSPSWIDRSTSDPAPTPVSSANTHRSRAGRRACVQRPVSVTLEIACVALRGDGWWPPCAETKPFFGLRYGFFGGTWRCCLACRFGRVVTLDNRRF